tara:strand:- start:756 stop:1283 length:528 start_codon:yes stop_codon:yes gene_type:complete
MTLYTKREVYYISQWIPTKLHCYFEKKRYCHCLQTKNYQQAVGIANQLRKRYQNEFAKLLGKAIKIAEPILPKENSINPKEFKVYKINPNNKTKLAKRKYIQDMKKTKGCSNCGYNENPDILHYHHINPETKIDNISRMVGKNNSLEKILAEIDKCELLCITCHHKEHGIKDNYV